MAFALAPAAVSGLGPISLTATFCLGGSVFCFLDVWISRAGGSKAQFMAMLMDFFPEAISLGAVFGHNRAMGMLLAAFIAAQNLPEGFNSYREITAAGVKPRSALSALFFYQLSRSPGSLPGILPATGQTGMDSRHHELRRRGDPLSHLPGHRAPEQDGAALDPSPGAVLAPSEWSAIR